MASPLVQDELEIPIKVSVTWDEPEKLSILVARVKEVSPDWRVRWWLKKILQEIGVEEDEDHDNCVEFQTESVDSEDLQIS